MFRAANFDGSFGKKKQVALGGKREVGDALPPLASQLPRRLMAHCLVR